MNLSMYLGQVNWLSVIVTTVVVFILGFIWYSVLFKKPWGEMNKAAIEAKANPVLVFGLSFIQYFVAVAALDLFIGVHGTIKFGLLKGLFVSIAWIVTSLGVTYHFENRPLKLFLIDACFYVVSFAVAGIILGAWY